MRACACTRVHTQNVSRAYNSRAVTRREAASVFLKDCCYNIKRLEGRKDEGRRVSVLYPSLWDEFLCAGHCSLSYEPLPCIFRELGPLIAFSFANVIVGAVLVQADCECLVLQLLCNVTGSGLFVVVGYSVTSLAS